jgi:CxxC motif-containing protein
VKVIGGQFPLASVKTTGAIPKDRIFSLIEKLRQVELKAPVNIGQVVFQNIFDTGFDVVVTRPVERR